MKTKIILSFAIVTCIAIAATETVLTHSSGAPANSTGAPGEITCVSCHSGTLNSGPGTSSITGISNYSPGQTYTITVTISQGTLSKFGFEITSLKDSNNTGIGTYTNTDVTRTLMMTSNGKTFMTHSTAGSTATSPGNNSWSFNWTAPSTNVGNISFYLATNAANSNGSTSGDFIYSKKLTVGFTPGVPSIVNAGADQMLCGTSTTLAGNTPTSGSGNWTVIGGVGGIITTPTSPNSKFTGTLGSAYSLKWTIGISSDDVIISLSNLPTVASAGADQTACGTSLLLSGNAATSGSGSWIITGGTGGTITNSTSPISKFTGTANATYSLRWTISKTGCTSTTDDVKISLKAPIITLVDTFKNVIPDAWSVCRGNKKMTPIPWILVTARGAKTYTVGPLTGFYYKAVSPVSDSSGYIIPYIHGQGYTVTGTDANGCVSAPITKTVSIKDIPTVDAGQDKTITVGTAIKIGSLALPATNSYNWTSVPVGYSSTLANPSVTPTVSTTFTMKATHPNGCPNTGKVVIKVQ